MSSRSWTRTPPGSEGGDPETDVLTTWQRLPPLPIKEEGAAVPLTSVGVVQEDELVPVVVVEQRQQRSSDGRTQLQRELALALGGEAGRDEGDVQGAAEGRQRVDRALVVQAEDGEDAAGVLGTDWRRNQQEAS